MTWSQRMSEGFISIPSSSLGAISDLMVIAITTIRWQLYFWWWWPPDSKVLIDFLENTLVAPQIFFCWKILTAKEKITCIACKILTPNHFRLTCIFCSISSRFIVAIKWSLLAPSLVLVNGASSMLNWRSKVLINGWLLQTNVDWKHSDSNELHYYHQHHNHNHHHHYHGEGTLMAPISAYQPFPQLVRQHCSS